jgi:hypothetical protein
MNWFREIDVQRYRVAPKSIQLNRRSKIAMNIESNEFKTITSSYRPTNPSCVHTGEQETSPVSRPGRDLYMDSYRLQGSDDAISGSLHQTRSPGGGAGGCCLSEEGKDCHWTTAESSPLQPTGPAAARGDPWLRTNGEGACYPTLW